VKVLLGGEGERPASGYRVSISGKLYKEEQQQVSKESNAAGLADFGLVRPGSYTIRVETPWLASDRKFAAYSTEVVEPGSVKEVTIRVPEEKLAKTDVRLQFELPEDLRKQGVTTYIEFRSPVQKVKGVDKEYTYQGGAPIVHFIDEKTYHYRSYSASNVTRGTHSRPFYGWFTLKDYDSIPPSERREPVWLTAEYRIGEVLLLLPDRRLPSSVYREPRYFIVERYYFETPETFTPESGKQNLWKITLPPKLIESARTRMKAWNQQPPKTPRTRTSDSQLLKKLLPTRTSFDNLTDRQKRTFVAEVREYFLALDESGDGTLQEKEWNASQRILPIFLKGKIDLTKDMTEREFVLNYIRLIGDPSWKRSAPAKKTKE
jgi:hypothetical protein